MVSPLPYLSITIVILMILLMFNTAAATTPPYSQPPSPLFALSSVAPCILDHRALHALCCRTLDFSACRPQSSRPQPSCSWLIRPWPPYPWLLHPWPTCSQAIPHPCSSKLSAPSNTQPLASPYPVLKQAALYLAVLPLVVAPSPDPQLGRSVRLFLPPEGDSRHNECEDQDREKTTQPSKSLTINSHAI